MSSTEFTARYLTVDGASAYVELWGTGQPIFCIHTAGQSGVQYREAAADLAAQGFCAVVPDLPGHGRSDPHPGGPVTDLGIYSEWCVKLMEELRLERPAVVGCSIGGKITLDIASRLGDRIRCALSMAAEAGHGRVNLRGLARELEDIAAPSRSDRTYYGTLAVVGDAVDAARRERIARMHRREDPEVSVSDLIGWGNHNIWSRLQDITAPALLVAGGDDLWIDAANVEAAAREIGHARFAFLDGIGHYPMEEMPDFAAYVVEWIREADAAFAAPASDSAPSSTAAPAVPPAASLVETGTR
jgi:pimeloyl-ACP methyl ester carboxylesterase